MNRRQFMQLSGLTAVWAAIPGRGLVGGQLRFLRRPVGAAPVTVCAGGLPLCLPAGLPSSTAVTFTYYFPVVVVAHKAAKGAE